MRARTPDEASPPPVTGRGARASGLRRTNLASVLRHVHLHGGTTRSTLTAAMGLNRSTIAALVGELVELGLVDEVVGTASTGPGRPSPVVHPRADGAHVLAIFDEVGVRFAHEVHPSEIAYDYWTTVRALEAIGHREAFGLNFDPSHFVWQDLDPVGFLWDFKERIYHVDCKEARKQLNGRNGRLGSHVPWADPRRGWDFVSVGHGDVPWEDCFRMLNAIGYDGPISVEWEDAGMDRLFGAPEALEFLRKLDWDVPTGSFDRVLLRMIRTATSRRWKATQ